MVKTEESSRVFQTLYRSVAGSATIIAPKIISGLNFYFCVNLVIGDPHSLEPAQVLSLRCLETTRRQTLLNCEILLMVVLLRRTEALVKNLLHHGGSL